MGAVAEQLVRWNAVEERAMKLLGNGVPAPHVASTLGISESRVSQLMSQEEFAAAVVALRYEALAKHNAADSELDELETELRLKVKESMALMFRPEQLLKAFQIINSAKRRGSSAPEAITQQQTIVQISMPVKVINRFTKNVMNQVVEAGDQKLVTVQSGILLEALKLQQSKREQSLLLEGNGGNNGHERPGANLPTATTNGSQPLPSTRDFTVDQTPARPAG